MQRPVLFYLSALTTISTIATGLTACPEPPPRVGATLDLSRPAVSPAPRIPLVPVALRTQADFDALEERYGARAPASLLGALDRLASAAKPGERPEDALLLMRLGALYRDLDEGARGDKDDPGYLQKALVLGTRLRAEAPTSPHTLFLQGYIPFAFLNGGDDRAMVVTRDTREFAAACRDQWRALLAAAPDYNGPRRIDHARIGRVVSALDEALAALAKPAPDGAVPSQGSPATRGEVLAMNLLERFAGATEGDRKVLCKDWESGAPAEDANRSALELQLDLACVTMSGKVDKAVPLIARLRDQAGAAFSPCLALARLGDRAPAEPIEAARKSAGLAACP